MQAENTSHLQKSAGERDGGTHPLAPSLPRKDAGKRGKAGRRQEGKEKKMSEPRMGGMKGKHIQNW